MTETQIQSEILKTLAAAGTWAFRVNSGSGHGRLGGRIQGAPKGTPDICVPALGWLECKLPGEKLRPDQEAWFAKAQREGVRCAVVTSAKEALEVIGEWNRERDRNWALVGAVERWARS